MAKISITKPTGSVESLSLISAFKAEGNTYVILDSERLGSMGLPIIYVCKYTTKLEKIVDENEWQSAKNHLKGIINGNVFEYFNLEGSITADEVYYTPLTLPQASFDSIKSKYNVTTTPTVTEPIPVISNEPLAPPTINIEPNTPLEQNNIISQVAPITMPSVEPVMPNNNVSSNTEVNNTFINTPSVAEPIFEVKPIEEVAKVEPIPVVASTPSFGEQPTFATETPNVTKQTISTTPSFAEISNPVSEAPTFTEKPTTNINNDNISFENDKETFIKACENMFDALVSKYEKKLADIERREQELIKKEQEIATKMQNASEHLANAEARETVANIAHDNAKKVMDITSFMPTNPNDNQTGVI